MKCQQKARISSCNIPDSKKVKQILDICSTSEPVRAHGRAVCMKATQMAERLTEKGVNLNIKLLQAAALLHDMCRPAPHHAEAAAKRLRDWGYPDVAKLVEIHHGGRFSSELDESQILFLADKLVQGTMMVSLKERFDQSLEKCLSKEARQAHAARFQMALEIQNRYRDAAEGRAIGGKSLENSVDKMLDSGGFGRFASLLDIGCGYGKEVEQVWEQRGIRMFGFDKDEAKIDEALRRQPCAMLRVADAEEMNYPDRTFDGILMKQTLSAVNMQRDALYLARCALKDSGRLYIADYYLRVEDPAKVAAARELATTADREAILHGNCVSRQVKRPSRYCVGRAFVMSELLDLLEESGLQMLNWEDASHWEESGSLEPQEGYFFLTARRKA